MTETCHQNILVKNLDQSKLLLFFNLFHLKNDLSVNCKIFCSFHNSPIALFILVAITFKYSSKANQTSRNIPRCSDMRFARRCSY